METTQTNTSFPRRSPPFSSLRLCVSASLREIQKPLILTCVLFLTGAVSSAEGTPTRTPAEWVKLLGADKFADREAACKALIGLGADVEPVVKKALEDPDAEVRRRASQVLASLTPVNFSGDYVRIGSESIDVEGQSTEAVNEKGSATLTIDKGLVFLFQEYSNMKISQTYTFAPDAKLEVRGKGELKMTWSQISQLESYFPDSGNPRLTFETTANGPRVTFEANDTNGTAVKMLFARQADIDKDPALKAGLKQQAVGREAAPTGEK